MFCLTCLWNIYISCCRSCHRHRRMLFCYLIHRNEIHTEPEGVQIFIIISTGQKNFFIFVLLSSCIKIAGEAHKMQKCTRQTHTHLFAFSIPNKSFSTTDCFRHINVQPRSTLQYWGLYNANWMRKQWLKIKLPYLCATASAHFVYCW